MSLKLRLRHFRGKLGYAGFPKLGVTFWGLHNQDCSISGPVLGSAYLRKLLHRVSEVHLVLDATYMRSTEILLSKYCHTVMSKIWAPVRCPLTASDSPQTEKDILSCAGLPSQCGRPLLIMSHHNLGIVSSAASYCRRAGTKHQLESRRRGKCCKQHASPAHIQPPRKAISCMFCVGTGQE